MAFQLIYTSIRRGLIPGRSGYTVAARHRQIRDRLVAEVERVSGYTFAKSGISPVIYAHRKLSVSGVDYHVLTRNVDAGSDYTGRTNHLAHHLICEEAEIESCKASPAEILAGFGWCDKFEEEPRYFDDSEIVDLSSCAKAFPLPASHWRELRGEAGDAALLVEGDGKPAGAVVAAKSGGDADQRQLLALFGESSQLIGKGSCKAGSWAARFTTYFQSVDNLADFDWVGCGGDNALLERPGHRRVLDISGLNEPTPKTELAKRAVSGIVVPPIPTPIVVPAPDVARGAPASHAVAAPSSGEQSGGQKAPRVAIALPPPSLSKSAVPSSTMAAAKVVSVAAEQQISFLSKNRRLVFSVVAAAAIVTALLVYYIGSVQPWQRLGNEVGGHLTQREFGRANSLLDQMAEKRPAWLEKIQGLRGEVVFGSMAAALEEEIDAVGEIRDPSAARKASKLAASKLEQFRSFARMYEITDGAGEVDDLGVRLEGVASRIPKEVAVVVPRSLEPGIPAGSKDPVVDPPGGAIEEPVVADRPHPKAIYLFLNKGLKSIEVPESLPGLVSGEKGSRVVTLQQRQLTPDGFPPLPMRGGTGFRYKFPESAVEEENPLLPIGGGFNVELKFQGGRNMQFVKMGVVGGTDAWGTSASRVFSFAGAEERFQILWWDGSVFVPEEPPFRAEGTVAVALPSVTALLVSLKAGEPSAATPRAVVYRFTAPPEHFAKAKLLETARLPLPITRPEELKIDFGLFAKQRRSVVDGYAKQIEIRTRVIDRGAGYFEWHAELTRLDRGLRDFGIALLGEDTDLVIRYRKVIDYVDPRRARSELRDFSAEVLDEFVRDLEEMDLREQDVERVRRKLSGEQFVEEWDRGEVEEYSAEEFVEFMEGVSGECRSLTRLREQVGFDDEVSSFRMIRSRVVRERVDRLADEWEKRFAGEAGRKLWEFMALRRPAVPRNLKQIENYRREIPALKSRMVEAQRSLAMIATKEGGGLPPGRYEICLEFPDGELRPFISSTIKTRPGR